MTATAAPNHPESAADPVVVVGAGPTGLMLACELALAKVRTVVLDRRTEPAEHAPGQAVNAAVMQLLDQRGLGDRLRGQGMPLPGAHFSLIWLRPELLDPQPVRGLLVPQNRLEALLEQRARELGVELRRGQEVTGLDTGTGDGPVTLRLRGADGREGELTASYLVGADGTESAVRRLAGIPFPGSGWTVEGSVGDVEVDFAQLAPNHLGAHYVDSGGVYSGAPAGPDLLRVITTGLGPAAGSDGPVGLPELQADIKELTGRELPARELRWAERFTSVSGNAERYRHDRVLLAGDAAHSFFPLGGLRLSTCLQDAVNLGWKLAAQVNGWAPPGLLDSYHDERHPEGERARAALDAQLALMEPPGRTAGVRALVTRLAGLEEVNRHLVELVTGIDVRYAVTAPGADDGQDTHPLIGRRIPDAAPLPHDGRGLLLVPEGADGLPLTDLAAGWADRVATAVAPDGVPAPALVRPDGHVVWTTGAGEPAAALARWFGEPR
ncbi:FAD-dependent monooxygenase [Kitasatospora sp. NPDC096204]|uniref:FAD-dependent monooxygenase n=1 Tax=Kitasatospora sp. NPDC096204 TaxID=3364094 RepID=UPI00380D3A49